MEKQIPVVQTDDSIIESAIKILESRISYSSTSTPLTSPQASKDYVKLQLATYEHEVFACLFLDNKHRVITFEKLFRGSINSASVYPREVVKACLKHNAAAVILAHNHPSGVSEPSQADLSITRRLSDALALIDVRILDHLVVGAEVTSFAERGLI
jgi:DNA repair protein RadC